MTKIRKYNGVYKLPIHKHTPKRRPMSMYIIYTSGKNLCFDPAGSVLQLVTDISKGLENPLDIQKRFDKMMNDYMMSYPLPYKHQKGDWNEWHKDMEEQLLKNPPRYSLLTRAKNKLRRK